MAQTQARVGRVKAERDVAKPIKRNTSITDFFKPLSTPSQSSNASSRSAAGSTHGPPSSVNNGARAASSSSAVPRTSSSVRSTASQSSTASTNSSASDGSAVVRRSLTSKSPSKDKPDKRTASTTDSETSSTASTPVPKPAAASPRKKDIATAGPIEPVRPLATKDINEQDIAPPSHTAVTPSSPLPDSSSLPPSSPLNLVQRKAAAAEASKASQPADIVDLTEGSSSEVTPRQTKSTTLPSVAAIARPALVAPATGTTSPIVLSSDSSGIILVKAPSVTPQKRSRSPAATQTSTAEMPKIKPETVAVALRSAIQPPSTTQPIPSSMKDQTDAAPATAKVAFVRTPSGSPLSSVPTPASSSSRSTTAFVIEVPPAASDSDESDSEATSKGKATVAARRSTRQTTRRVPPGKLEPPSDSEEDEDTAQKRSEDGAQSGASDEKDGGSDDESGSASDDSDGGATNALAALLARAKARQQAGTTLATASSSSAMPSSEMGEPKRRSSRVIPPVAKVTPAAAAPSIKKTLSGQRGKFSLASLVKERTIKTSQTLNFERGRALLAQDDLDPSSAWSDEEDLPSLGDLTAADVNHMTATAGKALVDVADEDGGSPQKRKAATVQGQMASVLSKTLASSATGVHDPVFEKRARWVPVKVPAVSDLWPSTLGSQPKFLSDLRASTFRGALHYISHPEELRGGSNGHAALALIAHACHHATEETVSRQLTLLLRCSDIQDWASGDFQIQSVNLLRWVLGIYGWRKETSSANMSNSARESDEPGNALVTAEMQQTVVRRWLRVLSVVLEKGTILLECSALTWLLQLAVDEHSEAYRDQVEQNLLLLGKGNLAPSTVAAIFTTFRSHPPRVQLEVVRAIPLRTRPLRDLQRAAAWCFLTDQAPPLSAYESTTISAPSLAADMIPYLIATSEKANDSPLIVTADTVDRDLYARSLLLTVALTDVEDELHAMYRDGQKEAAFKLEHALTMIDANIRQDIRSSDPLRHRAKNNLMRLATSIKYQSTAASGRRRTILDLAGSATADDDDILGKDSGKPRASAGGLEVDEAQTTLFENKFVKLPSPKKARLDSSQQPGSQSQSQSQGHEK